MVFMRRREFLANIAFSPTLDTILRSRENTKTLHKQIEIIKSLWELSEKTNSIMFLTLPFWHFEDGDLVNTIRLQVNCVTDKVAIIQLVENFNEVSISFNWVNGNIVELENMPEVINFHGVMFPIVECFRLEIPERK